MAQAMDPFEKHTVGARDLDGIINNPLMIGRFSIA